jgi:broad specificity phosphatase PhoE
MAPTVNVSLLIAEEGARWLERAQAWRKPANEFLVLSQHHEESNQDFRVRVEERIARLGRQRSPLDQVMLVAGRRWDTTAVLARAQMLGSLLAKLGDNARILLDPGKADDPRTGMRLRALARTVVELAGGHPWRIQIA